MGNFHSKLHRISKGTTNLKQKKILEGHLKKRREYIIINIVGIDDDTISFIIIIV